MSSSTGTLSPRASPEPLKSTSSKKRKATVPEIEVDITLPEPPSKKAKRALKKGKVLPPKPNSDDDDSDADGKKTDSKKKERSPHSVWIGNLRFTVTRDDLREWLVSNSGGTIAADAITRVHLPASKNAPKNAAFENRGFAYVDFASYEANVAAIALSETEWHRRKLLIKDAGNYDGRPAVKTEAEKEKEEEEAAPVSVSRKIFVGNLGFQTTEEDVRELFAKCGEIEWVKVATFEDSGKCKGYGWVKFAEATAADWAVKGFVKIKEVEETEEDFIDEEEAKEEKSSESESSSSGEEDDSDGSSSSDSDSEGSDSDNSKSDSGSGSDSDSSSEDDKKTKLKPKPTPANKTRKPAPAPEKKVKMRKWWVNTLHGRRLKIEHAEDDQTRYKKRFKKNPDAAAAAGGGGGAGRGGAGGKPPQPRQQRGGNFNREKVEPSEKFSQNNVDISVARLTGAPVKSQGKKTTFE